MTLAVLILGAAVLILAAAVLTAAWWHLKPQAFDSLNEEQCAINGRPLVGAKILKFAAEDANPPLEDEA